MKASIWKGDVGFALVSFQLDHCYHAVEGYLLSSSDEEDVKFDPALGVLYQLRIRPAK